MNQAWVDKSVIEPALDFKVTHVQVIHDQQKTALLGQAFAECSAFAFRRNSARAQAYLKNNLIMRIRAGRIEERYDVAMARVRELRRLIGASVDGRVMMDGDTTAWLFDSSYTAHTFAAKWKEERNDG